MSSTHISPPQAKNFENFAHIRTFRSNLARSLTTGCPFWGGQWSKFWGGQNILWPTHSNFWGGHGPPGPPGSATPAISKILPWSAVLSTLMGNQIRTFTQQNPSPGKIPVPATQQKYSVLLLGSLSRLEIQSCPLTHCCHLTNFCFLPLRAAIAQIIDALM